MFVFKQELLGITSSRSLKVGHLQPAISCTIARYFTLAPLSPLSPSVYALALCHACALSSRSFAGLMDTNKGCQADVGAKFSFPNSEERRAVFLLQTTFPSIRSYLLTSTRSASRKLYHSQARSSATIRPSLSPRTNRCPMYHRYSRSTRFAAP